jgi:hypothetical protein
MKPHIMPAATDLAWSLVGALAAGAIDVSDLANRFGCIHAIDSFLNASRDLSTHHPRPIATITVTRNKIAPKAGTWR